MFQKFSHEPDIAVTARTLRATALCVEQASRACHHAVTGKQLSCFGDRHGEVSAGQLQDLSLGAAGGDRAAREDDRLRVPAYRARQPAGLVPRHLSKVPVLRIDDSVSLFESNAIAEYLDETIPPRLHPEDLLERAVNRAWTDYVPSFAEAVTGCAYADSEADCRKAVEKIPVAFERLEKALEKQGSGPYFNGARYSLVDAAYAPFLQRYHFLDRVTPLSQIERFPRLAAWSAALMERRSTHSFPPAEFEAMYRANVKRRNKWLSRFIDAPKVAAA
jgi:glutathione S-transferase